LSNNHAAKKKAQTQREKRLTGRGVTSECNHGRQPLGEMTIPQSVAEMQRKINCIVYKGFTDEILVDVQHIIA